MRKLSHYRRPFLAAERVIRAGELGNFELSNGNRSLVLTVEAGNVDAVHQLLEQLCQPDSGAWIKLREGHHPGLAVLLDQLDRVGWVREGDDSGRAQLANEADELQELVLRATDWLVESAPCVEAMGCDTRNGRTYAKALARVAEEAAAHLGEFSH